MAQQAPLHNNPILILLIAFCGCHAPEAPVHTSGILLNKNEQSLKMVNGILNANNKPFSGTLFMLFPKTTDTAELATYQDGKEQGEWKQFYPSKKIMEKRYFREGQKTGEYIAWWENGNTRLQYFFLADEYEGTCREWNETGLLTKVMHYKRGHEEGQQQCWYDNGKIKANYIIKDGRRYGLLGTKNCINVSDSIFKN